VSIRANPSKAIVLVVEDDTMQRWFAASLVEDAGLEAIEAYNADVRIVFTDINMPGSMDGMKLAACIRDRWPPVEIILTSGDFAENDIALPARGLFFPKPYDPKAVSEAMRRMAS
jgi:CheY-like chemotaxis protein